jgi:HD-GYP domain-containing protein (c-di-GMP phosphodiesterase class II)
MGAVVEQHERGPDTNRQVGADEPNPESALDALRAMVVRQRRAWEQSEAQQLLLAQDVGVAYREARALARQVEHAYLSTIRALARAIEVRDDYTGGHIERVRGHSVRVGAILGLDESALRQLEYGAVLHDVGKIGIPDAVLGKPGALDADEWVLMRAHPEIGRRMLADVPFLAAALDAVAHHHERWDGRGYPAGLGGEAIPLPGRIVAVADAFDAMTSDRPYRPGLPREVALAEIVRGRGAQFDPAVADAFLTAVAAAA